MALFKETVTDYGVTANYWVVESLNINRKREAVFIEILPYLSQEAKEAGANPIKTNKVSVRVENVRYPALPDGEADPRDMMDYDDYFSPLALEGKDVYTVAYNYIKLRIPEFADAEDV